MTSPNNIVFVPEEAVRHLTTRESYNGAVSAQELLAAVIAQDSTATRILTAKAGLVNSDVQQAHVVGWVPAATR